MVSYGYRHVPYGFQLRCNAVRPIDKRHSSITNPYLTTGLIHFRLKRSLFLFLCKLLFWFFFLLFQKIFFLLSLLPVHFDRFYGFILLFIFQIHIPGSPYPLKFKLYLYFSLNSPLGKTRLASFTDSSFIASNITFISSLYIFPALSQVSFTSERAALALSFLI